MAPRWARTTHPAYVPEAKGSTLAAVGTGHTQPIERPGGATRSNTVVEMRALYADPPGDRRRGARFRLVAAERSGAQDRLCRKSRGLRRLRRRWHQRLRPGASNEPATLPSVPAVIPPSWHGPSIDCASPAWQDPIGSCWGRPVYRYQRRERRRLSGSSAHPTSCGRRDRLGARY
jgi:hypothetical protein